MIKCNKSTCKFYINGKCNILSDTNFGNKECPFYKEKKEEPKKKIKKEKLNYDEEDF